MDVADDNVLDSVTGGSLLQSFELKRVTQTLLKSKTFAGVSPVDAKLLVDRCIVKRFNPGEIMIQQGSIGSFMYLVVEGEVSVFVDDGATVCLWVMCM